MSGEGEVAFSGTDALLFAAICLLIGVFSRSFLKFVPLPYTVLLLVRVVHDSKVACGMPSPQLWGIWMGVGQATYASDWAYLSEGIRAWEVRHHSMTCERNHWPPPSRRA